MSEVVEIANSIIRRGEADHLVAETMAVMASGKNLARKVSIHDLFSLEDAIFGSSIVVGESALEDLTKHHFSDGVYIRELFIPKGMILTGAIHRTTHMSVLASGDISVLTVDGIKRMSGPSIIQTKPGIKRVGFAHEDTTWMDVHLNPTNERDMGKLWDLNYHNQKPE